MRFPGLDAFRAGRSFAQPLRDGLERAEAEAGALRAEVAAAEREAEARAAEATEEKAQVAPGR